MKKLSIVFLLVAILVLGACKHEHAYTDTVVAPTCTEQGYTEHTCECGDTYKDSTVEALGHTFGEWTEVKAATEEEEGLKERTCSVCQAKEEEKINKLPHTHVYGEWAVVEEPTDLVEGKEERVCACGNKEERSIEKLPHTHAYGEWEIILEPTTEAAGIKERVCACGDAQMAKISKIIDRPEEGIYVGTDLDYDTLEEALLAAQEGDKIILYPGDYSGSLAVTVNNLTIKGPNAGVNGVTGTRTDEAIISSAITITTGVTGVVIDGLKFTGSAGVALEQNASNITVQYCGFAELNADMDPAVDGPGEGSVSNIKVNYNFSSDYGRNRFVRFMTTVDGLEMIGNEIICNGKNYDFLNVQGTIKGTVKINNNKFVSSLQSFIYAKGVGAMDCTIEGNYIEGVANTVIDFRHMKESGDVVFNIKNNEFKNSGAGWMPIRIRNTDYKATDTLTINVVDNKFIDSYSQEEGREEIEFIENPGSGAIYTIGKNYYEINGVALTEVTAANFCNVAISIEQPYASADEIGATQE